MAAFNSMPALHSSGNAAAATAAGAAASDSVGGMDGFDHNVNFDDALLDGVNGPLGSLPFTPTGYDFDHFGTSYDDPFSYGSAGRLLPGYDGSAAMMGGLGAANNPSAHHGHMDALGLGLGLGGLDMATTPGGALGGADAVNSGGLGLADAAMSFGMRDGSGATMASGGGTTGLAGVDAGGADLAADADEDEDDLDAKLLSFSPPTVNATPLDELGRPAEPVMTAELYGMFFVAEDVFSAEGGGGGGALAPTPGPNPDGPSSSAPSSSQQPPLPGAPLPARPLELTCYRRNLWQCSGQVTLPRVVTALLDADGRRVPVRELAASIAAVESMDGKPTEIISIPWKSTAAASAAAEGKEAEQGGGGGGGGGGDEHRAGAALQTTAPLQITLDLAAAQHEADLLNNTVTVPVSWKRLQFKHATANNGRRKGLQQHYVVIISLLARTSGLAGAGGGGEWTKVAEIRSGPVIVRGRSPRNFDSRRDVPLSTDKRQIWERRAALVAAAKGGAAAAGSGGALAQAAATGAVGGDSEHVKLEKEHDLGLGKHALLSTDWPSSQSYSQGGHAVKKVAVSPSLSRPPVPGWSKPSGDSVGPSSRNTNQQPQHGGGGGGGNKASSSSSSISAQQHQPTQPRPAPAPSLPINLSLSEDERSPNRSASDATSSPRFAKAVPAAGAGGAGQRGDAHQHGQSPLESTDMLYEYFPLSVNDWDYPVEAIYRPHVVHHTIVPPEVKAQQVHSKTKRYFLPD